LFSVKEMKQKRLVLMATWNSDVDTLPLHTVLIASDQLENINVWESLFQQQNCIVLSESNVSDTLQSARLVGPSLMLVDMRLSRQERDNLLHELRLASRGPIILTVSADTVDQVIEANQAGADECLVRPVNPAVLIVKAMAWLGQGQRSVRVPLTMSVNLTA
jgi:DNA-binding response OmpR family regulator